MNGYFISITNNLLEDKHFEAMGNSVWLYMWLIDRMTDISEGQGIVNGGHPITYEQVSTNLSTLSERTYQRMIQTLRDAGYINTHQAKYGLYITINKAKKQFGKQASPARNGVAKKPSPAKSGNRATPKVASSPARNGVALYKEDNTSTNTKKTITNTASKSPEHEEISKLFFEAIKALKLPVTNHTTIKAKIKALTKEDDHDKIINYLKFIRDQYDTVDWSYKPAINTALDIYTKRLSIRNTFVKEIKDQTKSQSRVLKI